MKKVVMMAVLATVLGVTQVSAQSFVKNMMGRLYGGPKVEANVSSFFLSDMPGVSSKMNAGGSLGGFFDFVFPRTFQFRRTSYCITRHHSWNRMVKKEISAIWERSYLSTP